MSYLKKEPTKSKYFGRVVDNKDPKQMGKIRVVLEDYDKEEIISPWLSPATLNCGGYDMGEFKIPPINSIVLVEFIDGNMSNGVYYGSFPQWKETNIENSFPYEVIDDFDSNDEALFRYNPDNYIYKTAKGHKLFLCDNDGQEKIELQHAAGFGVELIAPITAKIRDKKTYEKLLKNKEFVKELDLPQGSLIRIYGKNNRSELSLFTANADGKSFIKMKTDKFELITKNGYLIIDEQGNLSVKAKNKISKIDGEVKEEANAKLSNYKSKKETVINTKETCCGEKKEMFLQNCGTVSTGDFNQIVSIDKYINLEVFNLFNIKIEKDKIVISDKTKNNHITLTNKDIEIKDINQNNIKLNNSGIEIKDINQNNIKLDKSGIEIKDFNQNNVKLDSSGLSLGSNVRIKLGNGNEPYIKLSSLITYLTQLETKLDTHTHISSPSGGPTTPCTASVPPTVFSGGIASANIASTKIFGE